MIILILMTIIKIIFQKIVKKQEVYKHKLNKIKNKIYLKNHKKIKILIITIKVNKNKK